MHQATTEADQRMNDNLDVSLEPPPSPIAASPAQVVSCPPDKRADPGFRPKGVAPPDSELNGAPHLGAGDFWPFVEALGRRWGWLLLGGATLGLAGLWSGWLLWKSSYTASAQLIRYDSPNVAEVFGFRPAAPQTFASLLRSPELLRRVGARASPPISDDSLASALRVMPERNSDIIVAAVSGRDPQATVDLANFY